MRYDCASLYSIARYFMYIITAMREALAPFSCASLPAYRRRSGLLATRFFTSAVNLAVHNSLIYNVFARMPRAFQMPKLPSLRSTRDIYDNIIAWSMELLRILRSENGDAERKVSHCTECSENLTKSKVLTDAMVNLLANDILTG